MNFHLKIDLYRLVDVYTSLPDGFFIEFRDIKNLQNWHDKEENVTKLEIEYYNNQIDLNVYLDDAFTRSYNFSNQDITDASYSGDYLIFDCFINDYHASQLKTLINLGVIRLNIDGYTYMYCYLQKSPNNVISKSLTLVDVMQIKVNIPLGVKSFTFEWDYTITGIFNYVHFPDFFRYYYVNSVIVLTNKLFRYSLTEDVLMSHESLIRSQDAFVTRNENSSNKDVLVDNRLPIHDTISYNLFTPKEGVAVNCHFDFKQAVGGGSTGYSESHYNIVVSTYTKEQYTNSSPYPVETAGNWGLPEISPLRGINSFKSLIQIGSFGALVNACVKDDTTASFIQSVIWLPFNAPDIFDHKQLSTKGVYANGKVLESLNGGTWTNNGSETLPVSGYWIHDGVCPYIIVADFKFDEDGYINDINNNSGIEIYSPISKWEIYVPFVGWVEVDINAVKSKRIFVYYALDLDTGLSTAYIYNVTDEIIIWSGTCQIGIRLNFATSNELENTKQKQANDLNMILGALSSVVSIGVGVATENPVAIVGGVLSAGKTIASTVQSNSMIFDRASLTFGTSNTALYSKTSVQVRRSYHYLIPIDDDVYGALEGYPCNEYGNLSIYSGYTEIGDINFNPNNSLISQDEINEIVALLKNGVIL